MRDFRGLLRKMPKIADWFAERGDSKTPTKYVVGRKSRVFNDFSS
jgi:hypothetical protein